MRWFVDSDRAWSPALYEAFFRHTPTGRRARRDEQSAVVTAILGGLGADDDVIEIGAGTGHYTAWLDRHATHVEVREPSPGMRRHLGRRSVREGWRRTTVLGGRLPGALGVRTPRSGAVAVGVLNYVADLDGSLRDLTECVVPNGWIVFNVPADGSRGRRYAFVEALGRRRVHCRSAREIHLAATAAGMDVVCGPIPAGVTDLYRCIRRS